MRKSLAGLVAAAVGASALVAGVAAPTVAAADTRSNCYVQLKAPSTVTIDRRYQRVTVTLIDSCKISDFTGLALTSDRYGFEDGFVFEGRDTSEPWDVYAGETSLGPLHTDLEESFAFDVDGADIAIKSTALTVKLGSKAAIGTKRKGSKVSIAATAKAYAPKANNFQAWNAGSATIQYRSGSAWKTLKSVKLKNGAASYTVTSKAKRTYRFVVGADGTHVAAVSATSVR